VSTLDDCLDRRAEAVSTAQVERALTRLGGELTDEQRAAVEQLGARIAAGVLAGPRARLGESADQATVRTVLELFD